MSTVDFDYYRGVAKAENLLGGEDSLRKEILDLCDEAQAAIDALTPEWSDEVPTWDNVHMWRLGEINNKAMEEPAGDYIDRGLILVRLLEERGYTIRLLPPKEG